MFWEENSQYDLGMWFLWFYALVYNSLKSCAFSHECIDMVFPANMMHFVGLGLKAQAEVIKPFRISNFGKAAASMYSQDLASVSFGKLESREWESKEYTERVGGERERRPVEPGQKFMIRKSDECAIYGAYSTTPPALPFSNEKRLFCCGATAWYPPSIWLWHTISFYFCLCFYDPCPGASVWPKIVAILSHHLDSSTSQGGF